MNEEEEVTTLLNDYYALNDRAIPYELPHLRAKHPRSDNSILPYIGPTGQGWPNDKIPPEIFEAIGRYLPRECLRNFRLSCKEFERKISHGFFTTVVVPFRPELFGGVEASHPIKPEPEGKGKAVARLEPMNENGVIFDGKHHFSCGGKAGKGDDHNGMNVFKAWGHHINKFGMSFEIHEGMISALPERSPPFFHRAFWGEHKWSNGNAYRFGFCELLEKTARRSQSMTVALSNISQVRELAISVTSGLGWLSGQDISERARLFKTKPPIFGKAGTDSQDRRQWQSWTATCKARDTLREAFKDWAACTGYFDELFAMVKTWDEGLSRPFTGHEDSWRAALSEYAPYRMLMDKAHDFLFAFDHRAEGVGSSSTSPASNLAVTPTGRSTPFSGAPLVPGHLTPAQKEYLLEMAWAQRAFMTSYTIAVIDNEPVFETVHTLNIATLSSRHISSLRQHDFWAALPNLHTLKMTVSPDWRDIFRDQRIFVDLPTIRPSSVVATLGTFLHVFISPLKSLKHLSLGWHDGGEHATGLFERNKHVLCAPLFLQPALMHQISTDSIVSFPYVTELTLNNCWITPSMLESFVQQHQDTLQVLRLTSVSLTASTKPGSQSPAALLWNTPLAAPPIHPDFPLAEHYSPAWAATIRSYIHRPESWPLVMEKLKADTESTELRIEFRSCGYVLLGPIEGFDQACITRCRFKTPENLQFRKWHLKPLMMVADDPMLGEIVPHMPVKEVLTLSVMWNMYFGWGNDTLANENLEDGQPKGGSGRFDGLLKREDDGSSS